MAGPTAQIFANAFFTFCIHYLPGCLLITDRASNLSVVAELTKQQIHFMESEFILLYFVKYSSYREFCKHTL
jgi:hypothetical protein